MIARSRADRPSPRQNGNRYAKLERTDQIYDDDETCEVEPAEPLFVIQMRCEMRAWARGREFRRRLFARQTRNMLRKLPDWYVAVIIASHMLFFPVVTSSVELLVPTAQVRVAERAMRDLRRSTLENIFSLVEVMHYSPQSHAGGREQYDSHLDSMFEEPSGLQRAVRSETAFDALASTLIKALDDPYSMYLETPGSMLRTQPAQRSALAAQPPLPAQPTTTQQAAVVSVAAAPAAADLGLQLRPWRALDGDASFGVSVHSVPSHALPLPDHKAFLLPSHVAL